MFAPSPGMALSDRNTEMQTKSITRRCASCDRELPLSYFDRRPRTPAGGGGSLLPMCRNCRANQVLRRHSRPIRGVATHGDTASVDVGYGKRAVFDLADIPIIAGKRWALNRHQSKLTLYAVHNSTDEHGRFRSLGMHRLILGVDDGVLVDHKDGDGLNNRRANLRPCTHAQNMFNRRLPRNNRSGFKGVYWHKNRWYAKIQVDRKNIHLGAFTDVEQAAHAYDRAARIHFGEFARLNFPEEG